KLRHRLLCVSATGEEPGKSPLRESDGWVYVQIGTQPASGRRECVHGGWLAAIRLRQHFARRLAGNGHDGRQRDHPGMTEWESGRMGEGEIRRVVAALVVAVCCAAVAGCSKKSTLGTVTGTVTLDGEPLKSGAIHFVPADGRTAAADATITDGKYTVELPPGEKRVTISSPKVVGKRKMYE